uniref:(northern house mosquito) hypothetical protein n=1 Tax=Culex pipiens TaxID=7175 RepID=A0A8D8FBD8_CULPI
MRSRKHEFSCFSTFAWQYLSNYGSVVSTKFNKAKYREFFQLFKNMFFKGGQTWTRAEASAAVQQPEAEPQKIGRIDRFDETVGFTARGGACTVEWFEGISVFGEDLRNQ